MSNLERALTLDSAGAAITKKRALQWDTTNADVRPATGAAGETFIGVARQSHDSGAESVRVMAEGPQRMDIGGAVAAFAEVAIDANGKAIALTSAEHEVVGVYDQPITDSSTGLPRALTSGESHPINLTRIKSYRPLGNAKRCVEASYDFTSDGGAISAIDLGVSIPTGARVVRAYYSVGTTFTSATDAATIALAGGGTTFKAATAISAGGNVWDAGFFDGAQDGTAGNSTATSSTANITLTIAGEAVTAGDLKLFVEYYLT